jgi:23S rRNA (adenine1618-N6)-methyltransferase
LKGRVTVWPFEVECRLQKEPKDVLYGVLDREAQIDFVICNPPFHASIAEAQQGSRRKFKNLSGRKVDQPELNSSGINTELIYSGSEYRFIQNLVRQSEKYARNCLWFFTLVSKQSNLKKIHCLLERTGAFQIRTIAMGTGNKSSRLVAWSFFSEAQRNEWRETRWIAGDSEKKPPQVCARN